MSMKQGATTDIEVAVTDHALLRFLERAHGIDVEGWRREIARHTRVGIAHDCPQVLWHGVRFVLKNGCVVTTLSLDMIPHSVNLPGTDAAT